MFMHIFFILSRSTVKPEAVGTDDWCVTLILMKTLFSTLQMWHRHCLSSVIVCQQVPAGGLVIFQPCFWHFLPHFCCLPLVPPAGKKWKAVICTCQIWFLRRALIMVFKLPAAHAHINPHAVHRCLLSACLFSETGSGCTQREPTSTQREHSINGKPQCTTPVQTVGVLNTGLRSTVYRPAALY